MTRNIPKNDASLPRYCPGFRGHPCGKLVKTAKGFCSSNCQGHAFEDLVEDILDSLEYKIQRNIMIKGKEIDILAVQWNGLVPIRFLVECKSGDKRRATMLEYCERVCAAVSVLRSAHIIDFGLLVFEERPSPQAIAFAESSSVLVCSIDDLLYRFCMSPRYLMELKKIDLAHSRPFGFELTYVNQPLKTTMGIKVDARTSMRGWLEDQHGGLLAITGTSGIGKSALLLKTTIDLLEACQCTANRPLPLFARIRDIVDLTTNIEGALLYHWTERYGLRFPSFHSIDRLLRSNRAILILDGLDELPSGLTAKRFLFQFQDFLREKIQYSKIVVSSRKNSIIRNLLGPLSEDIDMYQLERWTSEEVGLYFDVPGHDDNGVIRDLIAKNSRIRSLIDRPIFCRMMATLNKQKDQPISYKNIDSLPILYRTFTNYLLETDKWKVEKSIPELESILSCVAVSVFQTKDELLRRDEYPDYVQEVSFFEPRGSQHFSFFHRSFLEYWIAEGIHSEISVGDCSLMSVSRFSHLIPEFLAFKLSNDDSAIQHILEAIISSKSSDTLVINAVEVLGELNQFRTDHIAQMIFSDKSIEDQIWSRVTEGDTSNGFVKEALLNFLSILGSEKAAIKLLDVYDDPSFDPRYDSAFGEEYYGSIGIFLEETRKIAGNPSAHYDQAICANLLGKYGDIEDIRLLSSLPKSDLRFVNETRLKAIDAIERRLADNL